MDTAVKLTALAAENHLGKAVVAGVGAFLACRTLVNDAPADKFLLKIYRKSCFERSRAAKTTMPSLTRWFACRK